MLGLIGAAAAAFAAEFFDNRIGTPGELERVSGLPMLGLIPAETVGTPFEVQLTDARSGPSEALRSLAASLQFSTGHGLPRSLFLTSAGPDEGKSTTAIALAMNFANLGLKVLLIDGDLRRPLMHVKLGMSNDRGFSDVLCGNLRLMEAIRASATTNLYVLTSGATPSNPTELLGGSRLGALLSSAEEIVDVVIVDGPPVMGIADAPTLAHAAAATLFVAAAGEARSGTVIEALRRLRQARARIVGSVLTKFDARAAGYGHGYGYGVYGGYETYRHGDDGHRFSDQR